MAAQGKDHARRGQVRRVDDELIREIAAGGRRELDVDVCPLAGSQVYAIHRPEAEGRVSPSQSQAVDDEIDAAAVALYKKSPGLARDYLTDYSDRQSARVIKRWQRLAMELFMRYMDGNVRDSQGEVTHPPLPKAWYQHIIKDSGDLYKIRGQEKKDKE